MKQGFSSLELIMSMAISAIVMTSLFEIYNQITRNMMRIDRFVFEDTQLLTLKNRLTQDFAGLSSVWFTQAEVIKQKAATKVAKTENPAAAEKNKVALCFYSHNKDAHLDMLTFVTTAALQSFGAIQQRYVRVVYQVQPDPVQEGFLRLMRKEIIAPTENIDEMALQSGTFYELARGIKKIDMTYQLIDMAALQKQKADTKESAATTQESTDIIRSVKQWDAGAGKKNKKKDATPSDEQVSEEEEKQEDLGGAVVPKFVTMNIVFGATEKNFEKEYVLQFSIPSIVDTTFKSMVSTKKPAVKVPGVPEKEPA